MYTPSYLCLMSSAQCLLCWTLSLLSQHRLEAVQNSEELSDVYTHVLLYYGKDLVAMQNRWLAMEEAEGGDKPKTSRQACSPEELLLHLLGKWARITGVQVWTYSRAVWGESSGQLPASRG